MPKYSQIFPFMLFFLYKKGAFKPLFLSVIGCALVAVARLHRCGIGGLRSYDGCVTVVHVRE